MQVASRPITRHEELRRAAGYGTVELADLLGGFTHSYVSQVESGRCPPSKRYRRAFCRALGVSESFAFPEFEQEATA